MSEEGARRTLGRGLSALLGAESEDYASLDRVRLSKMVPIELVHPGRFQPRHNFDEAQLQALAESIRANGILQPILVRRHPQTPNSFEIVAGERRWRAAQIARLHEVPVIIREIADGEALELALVENVQRQDLSPLEEAEG
ncbi:MAG TPA: ParB/RepB/Spo0J family partition protein, partial [Dongiaceae bacterium]|nr:ParB/RepB/Spo0J family partition protein [Dongiaceae bacterium]